MPRFARHAVCSPLTVASEIGLEVLRDGGNAVDAAIATNLALAVAYPHMCGVGGDLFAMVWADGELVGLEASGCLPAAATLPADGVPQRGIGSATVPGAPAGWVSLAQRFATRPLRELAAPAIRLAREGVERSPGLTRVTAWCELLLRDDPEAARIFLADGLLGSPNWRTCWTTWRASTSGRWRTPPRRRSRRPTSPPSGPSGRRHFANDSPGSRCVRCRRPAGATSCWRRSGV